MQAAGEEMQDEGVCGWCGGGVKKSVDYLLFMLWEVQWFTTISTRPSPGSAGDVLPVSTAPMAGVFAQTPSVGPLSRVPPFAPGWEGGSAVTRGTNPAAIGEEGGGWRPILLRVAPKRPLIKMKLYAPSLLTDRVGQPTPLLSNTHNVSGRLRPSENFRPGTMVSACLRSPRPCAQPPRPPAPATGARSTR